MADKDERRVTFRADGEKVDYLDHLIDQKNVSLGPGSDEKITRSDLLRGCIEEHIEELEEDLGVGNPKQNLAVATAD